MLWWKPGMDMEAYVWGGRHAVVMGHAYEESSEEPSSQEAFHGKAVRILHSNHLLVSIPQLRHLSAAVRMSCPQF